MLFNIGGLELGLIILVFIMLFGANKIPEIARGIGKGITTVFPNCVKMPKTLKRHSKTFKEPLKEIPRFSLWLQT